MKKFVIVLLLLVPLIVLFTITASGMIISAEVAIAIESFELRHLGEPVTEVTINYREYSSRNKKYQLIPRYFPGVAQVNGFTWYSDNDQVATVDKNGNVSFHNCGFVKITAQSVDSVSVKASCTFYVEDSEIHDVSIYSYASELIVHRIQMRVYETEQVQALINPYVALAGDPAYASSDPAVFTCDQNGVLRATGEGSATLTLLARDKRGNTKTCSIPIEVSGSALVKQRVVYAYGEQADLTPYLASGVVVGGNNVDLSALAAGEQMTCTVRSGAEECALTLVKTANEHMIGIAGSEVLHKEGWGRNVYLAVGRKLHLSPVDLITYEGIEGVQIMSSDPNVLAVAESAIEARATGKATLTLQKEGYAPMTIEIVCVVPASYFSLNLDADQDSVGLGSTRVYGNRSIYDGEIVNGIRITAENLYPLNSDPTLFTYSVDSEYASVDANGLVTFREDAVGKQVTVTVKSLFSINGLSRSYTFRNIVKGVNVGFGLDANVFDEKKGENPSFAPYYDALRVQYESRDTALVFQTNVYLPTRKQMESLAGEYQKLCFTRDIYGNGYKLDGQFYQYSFSSSLFDEGKDSQLEGYEEQTGVTISDLFVNSYAPVGTDSKENFTELMRVGGIPVHLCYQKRGDFEVRFRYCAFQYAYSHLLSSGGTISYDGCVFRNSSGVSLLVQSADEYTNSVSVHNCIFSNSISLTGLVVNGGFPVAKNAPVNYNAFSWTGNNYIYNWKKTEEIRLDIIPSGILNDKTMEALMTMLNNKLNECARTSMIGDMNAGIKYKKGKDTYANLGILFIDYWRPIHFIINEPREKTTDGLKLEINCETASLVPFKMSLVSLGEIAKRLASTMLDLDHANMMLTNKSQDGSYNTEPGESYKLDQKTFDRLRGEV